MKRALILLAGLALFACGRETRRTEATSPTAVASAVPDAPRAKPTSYNPVGDCKLPVDGSPFVWPESSTRSSVPGRYAEPSDFVGRWVDRADCMVFEFHPDARFRWLVRSPHDNDVLCLGEGRVTKNAAQLKWSWGDYRGLRRGQPVERRYCEYTPSLLWPINVLPTVVLPRADELVIGYRVDRPTTSPRDIVLFMRLARIGSTANQPWSGDLHAGSPMLPGDYVIHAGKGEIGDLVVHEKRGAGYPYSLRWASGSTEDGEVFCVEVRGDRGCDGYRFTPQRGKPRLMHFLPGGQFTLTEVSSEADLKSLKIERSDGWSVFRVAGL